MAETRQREGSEVNITPRQLRAAGIVPPASKRKPKAARVLRGNRQRFVTLYLPWPPSATCCYPGCTGSVKDNGGDSGGGQRGCHFKDRRRDPGPFAPQRKSVQGRLAARSGRRAMAAYRQVT